MSEPSRLSDLLRQPAEPAGPLDDVFREEPVPLDVFITDKHYLGYPPLSDVQFDLVRHAEQVLNPETYGLMATEFGPYWNPVRYVNYLTALWGKGAGKDSCCRIISLRIGYLLTCMKSPQRYFGLPEMDTIHTLNVASSSGQAQTAFFTPMTRVVRNGWFADHCEPQRDKILWDSNIEMISGHSDVESQEGLNLILGIADELDAFKGKDEMIQMRAKRMREPVNSAEGILEMLHSSAKTRFPETFKVIHISYARFLGSPIMQRTEMARKDNEANGGASRYYVSGPCATWEVNPRIKGPEMFADDYEKDPVMARTKYECKPTRAVDPYFKNVEAVKSCFRQTDRDAIGVEYLLEAGRNGAPVWQAQFTISPELTPVSGALYVLHADLALRGDRAGVALAHVRGWDEHPHVSVASDGEENTYWESRPNVYVDAVCAFEASMQCTPAREIQIRWVRQLVQELRRRGFPIELVSYDSYQSADSMQILSAAGIATRTVSTDRDDSVWRNLRDLIYEGRVSFPESPLLHEELTSLMRLPNGKVDHPISTGKDLADAVACACLTAVSIGGEENDEGEAWTVSETVEVMAPDENMVLTVPFGGRTRF